ncbi:MAG: hypothetical protein LAO78_11850 [Acidobacteriia bacterium]|nr:hypothetical protein [Terriglobia bacterium]
MVKNTGPAASKLGSWAVALLLALFAGQASAETPQNIHIKFVNVADSTQGLASFSQFPAINNRGAVAFVAMQSSTGQEVFKWDRRELKPIASTSGTNFTSFADDVVINAAGIVAFHANLNTGGRATGIFTSDGFATKTIVDSTVQGLSGLGFGSPSINAAGTVAFFAPRNGLRSSIIFTGDGGALTPVLDTLNSNFGAFGNVAINASGEIVFRGILKDRNEGIFLITPNRDEPSNGLPPGPASVIDVIDTISNPDFFGFGDPVINDAGVAADFAGVALGVEILSGDGHGITARTDPTNGFFAEFEHPSINNLGAVAVSVIEANGAQGIFVELTGGASPVAVLQTGDLLFGSTVTAVSVGRFAFNDHFRLAFKYELADGRSGIAVASLQIDHEGQGEKSEHEEDGEK